MFANCVPGKSGAASLSIELLRIIRAELVVGQLVFFSWNCRHAFADRSATS